MHPPPTLSPRGPQNKMSVITPEKSTTARINGSKSHGPTTSAGLTVSSRNALRHGLSAVAAPTLALVSPVLPTESAADYQTLLHAYLQEFSPQGLLETELVETMAAARWRLRRVSTIETTLLANRNGPRRRIHRPRTSKTAIAPATPDERLAWTFHHIAEKPSLNLLLRYEATLPAPTPAPSNNCSNSSPSPIRELPNEPTPVPTPLEPEPSPAPDDTSASASEPPLAEHHDQGAASPVEAEEMST